jgi:hypothetical protein
VSDTNDPTGRTTKGETRSGWPTKAEKREGNGVLARLLRAKDELVTWTTADVAVMMRKATEERRAEVLRLHGFQDEEVFKKSWEDKNAADHQRARECFEYVLAAKDDPDPIRGAALASAQEVRKVLLQAEQEPDNEALYEPGLAILHDYAAKTRLLLDKK